MSSYFADRKRIMQDIAEAVDYIHYKIQKVKDRLNFTMVGTYEICTISDIAIRMGKEPDYITWIMVGNCIRKPHWGTLKSNYPDVLPGRLILDHEISKIYRFSENVRCYYRVNPFSGMSVLLEKYDPARKNLVNGKLKTADNEKLKAENEKLKADAEKLKTNAEKLKADNEKLKADNEKLKADNEKLKVDNEKLKADAEKLKGKVLRIFEESACQEPLMPAPVYQGLPPLPVEPPLPAPTYWLPLPPLPVAPYQPLPVVSSETQVVEPEQKSAAVQLLEKATRL